MLDIHDAERRRKPTGLQKLAQTQRIPFIIYADFECLLEQVPADEAAVGRNSNTNREREHLPVSVGLKLVSSRHAFQMPYEVLVQDRADDPEPVA